MAELTQKASIIPNNTCTMADSDKIVAREIIWSDLPERYDEGSYRRRDTKSEGTLLQIDANVLMSLLRKWQMSLIVSVHLERRLDDISDTTSLTRMKTFRK